LVDDFAILKQSIIDGLGIAVLPDYMAKNEIASGKLVNVLPDWGMEAIDIFALYPRNRAKIPKVKAFLDFISELYIDALN
jgi:LysR family transcriptional regulator AphB